MRSLTLTQIEATGIQDYIFGSNSLLHNVGGSELVARVTTHWVAHLLDTLHLTPNSGWDETSYTFPTPAPLTDPGVQAEVVYAGGGNALLLFDGPPERHAIPFTKALTQRVLQEARGLALIVRHIDVDGDPEAPTPEKSLAAQHEALRRLVARDKLQRRASAPLPGLSVTAACDFTGLPAVELDADRRLISQVVAHKLALAKPDQHGGDSEAEARLHKVVPQVKAHPRHFQFVRDFDLLGERGESSYLAVVHVDGNGMGKRFQALSHAYRRPNDNRAYIEKVRALSLWVNSQSMKALKATLDLLLSSYAETVENGETRGSFAGIVPVPMKKDDGRWQAYLPFRPIVFGGDDVTFVCEGRLGLPLAVCFLKTLADTPSPDLSPATPTKPLYARAGIAIVKSHFPFSRAYDLAETLAGSAKEAIKTRCPNDEGIVLDWHVSTGGVILDLDEIRARDYTSDDGHSLLMRPLRLDLDKPPIGSRYWQSWANFNHVTDSFRRGWASRRNKLKALQEALRQGEEAVRQFRDNYSQPRLPEIPYQQDMAEKGWQDNQCGYFDALEALDILAPLPVH